MKIASGGKILRANDERAAENRKRLDAAGVFCVNILGSPGAGKTTLLEALLPVLGERVAVIEGDPAASRDALRMEAAGAAAFQINTGGGCHLDATMVANALDQLDLETVRLLFVENIGNLVCTAGFDLGERLRIVVLSVAEGDDKVEKYPSMFARADAVFVSKTDLAPHTDFDMDVVRRGLARLAPDAQTLALSAKTGEGIAQAAQWLKTRRQEISHGNI